MWKSPTRDKTSWECLRNIAVVRVHLQRWRAVRRQFTFRLHLSVNEWDRQKEWQKIASTHTMLDDEQVTDRNAMTPRWRVKEQTGLCNHLCRFASPCEHNRVRAGGNRNVGERNNWNCFYSYSALQSKQLGRFWWVIERTKTKFSDKLKNPLWKVTHSEIRSIPSVPLGSKIRNTQTMQNKLIVYTEIWWMFWQIKKVKRIWKPTGDFEFKASAFLNPQKIYTKKPNGSKGTPECFSLNPFFPSLSLYPLLFLIRLISFPNDIYSRQG